MAPPDKVGKNSSLWISGAVFDFKRLGWTCWGVWLRKWGATYPPVFCCGGSIGFSGSGCGTAVGADCCCSKRFHGPCFLSGSLPDSSWPVGTSELSLLPVAPSPVDDILKRPIFKPE